MRISVNDDIPILIGTTATIQATFTGVSSVMLDGAVRGAPPLDCENTNCTEGVPEIPAKQGGLGEILASAPLLLERLATLTERLTGLLSDENQASISGILRNTDRMTASLADASPQVERTLAELQGTLRQATITLGQFEKTLGTTDKMLNQEGQSLAQQLRETLKSAGAAAESLEATLNDSRPAAKQLAESTLPAAEATLREPAGDQRRAAHGDGEDRQPGRRGAAQGADAARLQAMRGPRMMPKLRLIAAPMLATGLALALAGCVSLGKEPPETLFNLTPARLAATGSGGSGTARRRFRCSSPKPAARLDVLRVPVQVNDASVAYLQNAQWVEKPARLFTRLLEEAIRTQRQPAGGRRLRCRIRGRDQLSGQLLEMGYDVATGSVVVRYNAVLALPDGQLRTRRFESTVSGIPASAPAVAPALNQAANQVAADVAAWVG